MTTSKLQDRSLNELINIYWLMRDNYRQHKARTPALYDAMLEAREALRTAMLELGTNRAGNGLARAVISTTPDLKLTDEKLLRDFLKLDPAWDEETYTKVDWITLKPKAEIYLKSLGVVLPGTKLEVTEVLKLTELKQKEAKGEKGI